MLCKWTASFWMNFKVLWRSWKSADGGSILRCELLPKTKSGTSDHITDVFAIKIFTKKLFAEALELQNVITSCECLLCRAPKINSQNPPQLNHGDSHGTGGLNRHRKLAGEQSRKIGQRHRWKLGQHREDRVTERAGPRWPDRSAEEVCKDEVTWIVISMKLFLASSRK